jgi:DNA polymerase III subunit alpha
MTAVSSGFVHLHVHSSYSLLEGAIGIPALAKRALADAMPALALTDTNNLFGALEFSEKLAGAGIQPIVGIELAVVFDQDLDQRGGALRSFGQLGGSLVLLAASEQGYLNLLALSSAAFLSSAFESGVAVSFEALSAHSEGLIVLTGGTRGPIDRLLADSRKDDARARLLRLHALFGDRLYVEIQRFDEAFDYEASLVEWADNISAGLVATNDVLFARPDDHESHDALICIAEGRVVAEQDRRRVPQGQFFRTAAEMTERFSDLPDAIRNTLEVAQRCSYRPLTRKPILPQYSSEGDEGDELARQAERGLESRLASHPPAPGLSEDAYRARLAFELGVIRKMQYPGYFLIVSDFIKYAKQQGIPVGPGRGSGAGSLVAYALTITDIDPLRFGLLFERFLNPDRVSMPDFDIDFCQDRRGEVIDYVVRKYGSERVAQIITFGSLQARGVMRDVGRVLELPYGQVDKLTKLVPQNPANPVKLVDAIAGEPKLQEEAKRDPAVNRLLTIAQSLEGLYRHASTHAAGIVIGDRALQEIVPLYRDPRSDMLVTQFNMKWVEPAGLVKFDFLGLKTLTVLQKAVELLAKRGVEIDLSLLPLDDRKSYDMLSKGETVGVFQVESAGMRRALAEMKPDRLEDIIALVALYRPGPMANIPVYCKRKHGEEATEYVHPALKPVLEETFGVIVYQEQVMEIAKILSGYSLGEADLLRRAMGKKIKAEMDKQRSRFVTGAVERHIGHSDAEEIFDLLARFADYGFNKSHAAAYALVSYQTAYLKANYPVEFLAASMSLEMSNVEKLVEFKREAERLGIKVEAPSINMSGVDFDVVDGRIIYALSAVRGLGTDVARALCVARNKEGRFASIDDFAKRLPPKVLNKRVIETLASAGAFDAFGASRSRVFAGADKIAGAAQQADRDRSAGQSLLFSEKDTAIILPEVPDWSAETRLEREFDAVGFFLSGHPLDSYRAPLKRLGVNDYASFAKSVRNGASAGRLAASVVSRQERRTKTGSKMGIVVLSDWSGQYEILLFSEALQQFRELFEPGNLVVVQVAATSENDELRLRVQSAEALSAAVERIQSQLKIFIRDDRAVVPLSGVLKRRGMGEVSIVVMGQAAEEEVEVKLPGRHDVSAAMIASLKAIPGVLSVEAA